MQRLMRDLGSLADNVSEVDASDLDDLRITEQAGGGAVSLMLGDRNFSSRLRNFLEHYPDIHRKMPRAYVVRSQARRSDHGRGSWRPIAAA